MPRAKKGTPEGDKAIERWRETIKKKYGENWHAHCQNTGRKGGLAGRGPGYKGGFASNHKLASIAGYKGGRISRRNKAAIDKIKNNEDDIKKLIELGVPMTRVAQTYEINEHSLRYWNRKNKEESI